MKIAMVGLGKMGANMTERLIGAGHEVVAAGAGGRAEGGGGGDGHPIAPQCDRTGSADA